jgi:predicted nucleic acid-binding protein
MRSKAVVMDANILICAVSGNRARPIIEEHLASLVTKRGGNPTAASGLLSKLVALCEVVSPDLYAEFETQARRRLGSRDPDDWRILARALALNCPIWTEDSDFFGCGVATWTSENIELFLAH